jgi:GNAT superfamily N-acetyltransferase
MLRGDFRDPLPAPIGSLNRLAVDPLARGCGLSRQLDVARLEATRTIGCGCVVVATQSAERRMRQLQTLGFTVVGQGKHFVEMSIPGAPPPTVLVCLLPSNSDSPGAQ